MDCVVVLVLTKTMSSHICNRKVLTVKVGY